MHMCYKIFAPLMVTGCCLPKTTFRTKIGGGWAKGASINLGPLRIFATVATLNLVHNLGLGLAYQKNTFRTKIGRGRGQESIQKNWGPLRIFATAEVPICVPISNLVHKFGLGLGYQKRRLGPKLAGVWATGIF